MARTRARASRRRSTAHTRRMVVIGERRTIRASMAKTFLSRHYIKIAQKCDFSLDLSITIPANRGRYAVFFIAHLWCPGRALLVARPYLHMHSVPTQGEHRQMHGRHNAKAGTRVLSFYNEGGVVREALESRHQGTSACSCRRTACFLRVDGTSLGQ